MNKYVLVACECSQVVTKAFRSAGYIAFSCDLVDQYGGHPEWHIKRDCLQVISSPTFITCDGVKHSVPRWDLVIAHPPCTYLAKVQFYRYDRSRYGDDYVNNRIAERDNAVKFFRSILSCYPTFCDHLCVENPVGYMESMVPSSQSIQPYDFGHQASKETCLWLYNLPLLQGTNKVVCPRVWNDREHSYTSPWWLKSVYMTDPVERARYRSQTFQGIADAMVSQWGKLL